MGRPAFHKLSFSRFEPTNEYSQHKVLTIHSAPLNIHYSYKNSSSPITANHIQNFGNYLKIYPLQLACSIPCQYMDAPYKEEYIIPQLLMQWAHTTKQFQGVMYRSTRVQQNGTDSRLLVNFAFPVQTLNKPYCPQLVKTFNFTDPIPFEVSLASRVNNENPLAQGHTSPFVSDIKLPYWQTHFPVFYGSNTLINYPATDFYTAEVRSAYYMATPLQ